MEAVKPTSEDMYEEKRSDTMQSSMEVTVRDVWTKYFFNEKKLLCFQILLQLGSGKIVLYQELKDYSEYKNTLKDLQVARSRNAVIKIPRKSEIPVHALEKWHGFRKV